jgi:acyl carrier protein
VEHVVTTLSTPGTEPGLAAAVAGLSMHLLSVKPSLNLLDIRPESSLTVDLGFDSLDLVALAGEIRDAYPAFDLRSWLAGACQFGADSVLALAVQFAELAVGTDTRAAVIAHA